jgi:hypothetical protein
MSVIVLPNIPVEARQKNYQVPCESGRLIFSTRSRVSAACKCDQLPGLPFLPKEVFMSEPVRDRIQEDTPEFSDELSDEALDRGKGNPTACWKSITVQAEE